MRKILEPAFFDRNTLEVAQELLGKYLVRRIEKQEIALIVNEVEAYDGFNDKASHASRGMTPRNKVMFGAAGYFYLYFVYGVHWMLNIVTGPKNYPAALLIRGAGDINGPARLTKKLQIDRKFNQVIALPKTGLWFEDRGIIIENREIIATVRIGVDYAGPIWAKKPYRFVYSCSN